MPYWSQNEWFREQKTGNHRKLLLAIILLLFKLVTWLNYHVISNLIIFLNIVFFFKDIKFKVL